jgi:hypothetical protein
MSNAHSTGPVIGKTEIDEIVLKYRKKEDVF